MKNQIGVPFVRNRYFYGKLLTAGDFAGEQQYMNDKRRLVNQMLFGTGIVEGLDVIQVDEESISLEAGLALDEQGREILVHVPVIRRVADLGGFEEAVGEEGSGRLLLYLAYGERETEAVQNMANRNVHAMEEETFNKIREGYELYLVEAASEEQEQNPSARAYQEDVCLAELFVVKSGDFYVLEKVVHPVLQKKIRSRSWMQDQIRQLQEKIRQLEEQQSQETQTASGSRPPGPEGDVDGVSGLLQGDWQLARGQVKIGFEKGGRAGFCRFSGDIVHGLGLGEAEILLSVVQKSYCYGGAPEIFADEDIAAQAAYRLNPQDGTFVVGVRLLADKGPGDVVVNWLAVRRKPAVSREEMASVHIAPPLVRLEAGQTMQLQAVCVNVEETSLVWKVKSPEGGTISKTGLYRAPIRAGVYEVGCSSETPPASASAFVLVRD